MTSDEGLLIVFDEEYRRDFLIKEKNGGGFLPFSDALSIPDWKMDQLEIALLCFSELTISYFALVSRGKRVATAKCRVEFSNLLDLESVSIDELNRHLNSELGRYFIRSSQGIGRRLPLEVWKGIIEAIKSMRPSLERDIDRISALKYVSGYRLKGETIDILLQEREALGVALDIFNGSNQLRQEVLGGWAPGIDQVTDVNESLREARFVKKPSDHSSFMLGIASHYLQEESALQQDLFNWDGRTAYHHEAGISVFYQGNRKLEVIYANRNALEHTLGVDLIYYNDYFGSFVLVQYKLMEKKKDDGEYMYRPDSQLEDELRRMDEFGKQLRYSDEVKSHRDLRLNSNGFMIKLVPNYGLRLASGELIKGMYLTYTYIKFLIGPNGPQGKRGGSLITFDNSPRYMTNTEFIQFVNRGWIGSRGIQTSTLKELIKQFYETGRAVLVAYETRNVSERKQSALDLPLFMG